MFYAAHLSDYDSAKGWKEGKLEIAEVNTYPRWKTWTLSFRLMTEIPILRDTSNSIQFGPQLICIRSKFQKSTWKDVWENIVCEQTSPGKLKYIAIEGIYCAQARQGLGYIIYGSGLNLEESIKILLPILTFHSKIRNQISELNL